MEALSFSSLRVQSPSSKLVRPVPVRKWTCVQVLCQGGSGNVVKSVGISSSSSSTFAERERLADPGRAVKNAGSLVLSPNSTTEKNIAVKEMMPSLVEMDDGIGIVRFLRGKRFFITGATGFLAKGNFKN